MSNGGPGGKYEWVWTAIMIGAGRTLRCASNPLRLNRDWPQCLPAPKLSICFRVLSDDEIPDIHDPGEHLEFFLNVAVYYHHVVGYALALDLDQVLLDRSFHADQSVY